MEVSALCYVNLRFNEEPAKAETRRAERVLAQRSGAGVETYPAVGCTTHRC